VQAGVQGGEGGGFAGVHGVVRCHFRFGRGLKGTKAELAWGGGGGVGEDGSGWLGEFGGGAALVIAVEVIVEAHVPPGGPREEGGGGEAEEGGEVVRVCESDDDTVDLTSGTAAVIHVLNLCFTIKKQDGASLWIHMGRWDVFHRTLIICVYDVALRCCSEVPDNEYYLRAATLHIFFHIFHICSPASCAVLARITTHHSVT